MKNEPCEKCGKNRWKTVKKGKHWQCRNCGHMRFSNFIEGQRFIDESK